MDPWAAEPQPNLRRCDHPDCAAEGLYRAPKGRDRLRDYFWFCLDHVRQYNLSWDYFSGMNERDIERIRRRDTVWERPSWPLGGPGPRRTYSETWRIHDFFGLFEDETFERSRREQPARRATPEEEALAVFSLQGPVTMKDIKARYKVLVKLHHPDTNGGDKDAEERLKIINQAYTTLKNSVPA